MNGDHTLFGGDQMAGNQLQVFRPGEGNTNTTQTTGMQREELVKSTNSWVGFVKTEPKFTSGWHHHGDYDTYVYVISGELKLEFGKSGQDSCVAKPGEVAHIPKDTIHRESNPGTQEQLLFVTRVGEGAPVFNVDGPTELDN
jgi:uncharacterized RmlC-like cupin family protein